ncbi:methyl-accepting chemotaxis protein [Roseobacter sinensis]|uniref:Methyl-accepting chemotaxis protein n=1 Tax=Roseobacter sinensis TaxID=2931391 RepID=A0ABT3BFF5_9RHOB|nr:methyl-accepting chemotaxis protein [Roseobacter sp. WL0113]MCV3272310.1 methyl-accepting chemotaxis protein [Roseobacter sp. WL0113]
MSIITRIYLGMGAMTLLILAVGGFAAFQTNSLANTFEGYRGTAKTSLVANEMTEDLLEAKFVSQRYWMTKNEDYLASMEENLAEVREVANQLFQSMAGYAEQSEVVAVTELVTLFETTMAEALGYQKERDALLEQSKSFGAKAREQLDNLSDMALRSSDMDAISATSTARSALQDALVFVERFLVTSDAMDAISAAEQIALARDELYFLEEDTQDDARLSLIAATIEDLDGFEGAAIELIAAEESQNDLYNQLDEIGTDALIRMETALDAVVDLQNTLGPIGQDTARASIMIVLGIMALGTVAGGSLAFFSGFMISRELKGVTDNMAELAEGNLDVDIAPSDQTHEVAQMNNAMVVFLENARKARALDLEVKENEKQERERAEAERAREAELAAQKRADEEREREVERKRMATLQSFQKEMEGVLAEAAAGDFSNRMSLSFDDRGLVELAGVINTLLEATESNIGDIVRSIGELATGNLGIRIDGKREGAFERMQNDFNDALETLASTMARIMETGQGVSNTAADLEASSVAMAKRAEDSAAAIEETSAAVEEISASVRQVVENAKMANEATERVRQSADRSRQVSDETEASISEMTEASAEIHRVMKVIEDIAFQINLLALNAGVEAARAGEAGRGFSVVASEVRALARRSQDAVQEIGTVIDRNTQSVEAGVEKVGQSRKALEDIISEVEIASGQISDITTAVEQQALGVDEVNSAIQSIDKTAQTNAAALGEMTASCVSLNGESTALSDDLRQFRGVSLTSKATNEVKPRAPEDGATETARPPAKVAAAAGSAAVLDDGWEQF